MEALSSGVWMDALNRVVGWMSYVEIVGWMR